MRILQTLILVLGIVNMLLVLYIAVTAIRQMREEKEDNHGEEE